ncbi:MAG: glycosyltransferase family 4 protein, partial [Chloroflexota bacterium]
LMLQMQLWRQWQHVFDLIVANSTMTKHHLLSEGIEPVDIIWNGVTPRAEVAPLSARPTAVFAGRLVWEKGIDTLIRAFGEVHQHIPDAQLLIAGEGPEHNNLQSLIDERGLSEHIQLLGRLARGELEQTFAGAWVQIVPSRWDEPFGIVAAEASMRGTAVVASDTGGLLEIVQNEHTGYLVPPDNETKLASAMQQLLGNRDRAEQMGHNGHTVAMANFNEIRNADQFLERYEMLAQKKYTIGVAPKLSR